MTKGRNQLDASQLIIGKTVLPGGDMIEINFKGISIGVAKTAPGTEEASFTTGTAKFSFNASMFDDPNQSEIEKAKSYIEVKV